MNAAQSPVQFPNIFRFITEYKLSKQQILYCKVFGASFFSGILLIGIALQTMLFLQHRQDIARATFERERLSKEAAYWKAALNLYQGHRDIYYRIASLEYRLGNADQSKVYLKKVVELDPNFKEAAVLGAKVGL